MDSLTSNERDIFAVGEIAIMVNAQILVQYNGVECEVLKGPGMMRQRQKDNSIVLIHGYSVRAADGEIFAVEPHKLRKKKPPREDLKVVRWDQCPWQPETIDV